MNDLAKIALGIAAATCVSGADYSSALAGGANMQLSQRVRLYDYTYFSDDTYSTAVGWQSGRCYGGWGTQVYAGVDPNVYGQITGYAQTTHVGYCNPDGSTEYI